MVKRAAKEVYKIKLVPILHSCSTREKKSTTLQKKIILFSSVHSLKINIHSKHKWKLHHLSNDETSVDLSVPYDNFLTYSSSVSGKVLLSTFYITEAERGVPN